MIMNSITTTTNTETATTATTATATDDRWPTVPTIDDIMGGFRVDDWLRGEVEFKLGGSFLDGLIGLGVLTRLWSPSEEEWEESAQRVLAGDSPVGRARRFWRSLPEQDRRGAVWSTLLRVDDLMGDLPELRNLVAADPVAAAPMALDWLRRRDDLEAILFLARCTSDARVLGGALQTLDERAAAEHSIWFFLPHFDDERLRAVAYEEPDAWWAQVA
jgi:hypothetical protein